MTGSVWHIVAGVALVVLFLIGAWLLMDRPE